MVFDYWEWMPRQVRIEYAGAVYQARGDRSEGISLGEARHFAQSFWTTQMAFALASRSGASSQIVTAKSMRESKVDRFCQDLLTDPFSPSPSG
jgi:hypothetical protein